MTRLLRSLFFASVFMVAGFAMARFDLVPPASGQQPPPADSGPAAAGSPTVSPPPAGAAVKSAVRDAAASTPDLKLLLEQVNRKVEAVERSLDKLAAEARAKVVTYALWAAGGLFVLMLVSSMLGGAVAALILRRTRGSG